MTYEEKLEEIDKLLRRCRRNKRFRGETSWHKVRRGYMKMALHYVEMLFVDLELHSEEQEK